MDRKVLGGILLIGGTAIGAGMLALPVALARAGFYTAIIFLLLSWVYMTFTAFLLLEANLRMPRNSNIITMVKGTLGRFGEIIAWGVYLLLLYTLLSAYISGGSDLLSTIASLLHFKLAPWLAALLFTFFLGAIIAQGISFIDKSNRVLMFLKISLYLFLFFLVIVHVDTRHYLEGEPLGVLNAIPVLIAAFGFSVIVPSLRAYLEDDLQKIRKTILLGSLLPLVIYILWVGAILGTVPRHGAQGLMAILGTPHEVTFLAARLQESLQNSFIGDLFRGFSTISLLTSFLGVSLSLTDFLADGFSIQKRGAGKLAILILAFLPPLTVVWLNPALFILGLNYAGLCVVFLLSFLPAIMVWIARYRYKQPGYQVMGGRSGLILSIITSLGIMGLGVYELFIK